MKRAIHITYNGEDWVVRTAGAESAAMVTGDRHRAIEKGSNMAKRRGSELVVHRKDGTIWSIDSFGDDPFPPRSPELTTGPMAKETEHEH